MTEVTQEYVDRLKAELEAAKNATAEATAAQEAAKKEAAELKASAKAQGLKPAVTGSYKGHRFQVNHRRVRGVTGILYDTQTLLDKAKEKDAEAIAVLDWLIKIEYAYFTKEK
jgi:hypothetical protein